MNLRQDNVKTSLIKSKVSWMGMLNKREKGTSRSRNDDRSEINKDEFINAYEFDVKIKKKCRENGTQKILEIKDERFFFC